VEDDTGRVAAPRPEATHAVPQIDSIDAARSVHGPVVNSEDHRVALPQRNYFWARLHSRPLLGQDELAASKVPAGLRQQDGDLERKGQFTVEVLVEAVVAARLILKEKRRRAKLPGCMAEF